MMIRCLAALAVILTFNGFAYAGSCLPLQGQQGASCQKFRDEKACKADTECVWTRRFKIHKHKANSSTTENKSDK